MARQNEKVKVGDEVELVAADGRPLAAIVTAVHAPELIDLEAQYKGEELIITRSPLDESGVRPDSWRRASKSQTVNEPVNERN
ncbi:MAG: hypothetical protein IT447_16750 [Phycisphaerales bacterium]|nr:hypothetical protein [Phycisphaerales bacterium]